MSVELGDDSFGALFADLGSVLPAIDSAHRIGARD